MFFYHYACLDLWCVRRTNEIQHDGRFVNSMGIAGLTAPCVTGFGDGGILAFGAEGAWAGGAIDFAGGTVVHMSSGISALLIAILIGQRIGFGTKRPSSPQPDLYAMGAAMLWVGWFGFNAGSAAASNAGAVNAFVVTHLSAAQERSPGLEWNGFARQAVDPGNSFGRCSGTGLYHTRCRMCPPNAGHHPGACCGIVCYYACGALKAKLGYDDSLDAFGVHGVGGTLGALLIGIFATKEVGDADGIINGGGATLLIGQVVAVVVTFVFSIVVTFIIIKILDATLGLRVDQESEVKGLDLAEHGEEGYIFNR